MSESKDISQLVAQAKRGDQKAFNDLLNYYWKDVYRFQLGKSRSEDEAEDITIKSFARAFDKIDSFDEKYQFKTWLFTISNNLYIDELRKKKTETISIHKNPKEIHKIIDEDPSPADQLIQEQNLAQKADELWKGVEWSWYTNEKDILYWHWSLEYEWEMNFAIKG